MTVTVAPGQVAVPTQNNTGATLCSSDGIENVTLTAAPSSGTNRYDLIICRPRGNDLDGGANNDFIFDFVTGTPAASPAVPATPAGTVALAQIYVPGGSASVTAGNITDVRPGGLVHLRRSAPRIRAASLPMRPSIPRACLHRRQYRHCPDQTLGQFTFNTVAGRLTYPSTGRYRRGRPR